MLSAYYTKVLSQYISNYNGKCQPQYITQSQHISNYNVKYQPSSPTLRNVSTVQQHMDSLCESTRPIRGLLS